MIKKLEINNFKAFEHAELELKNFTLLAGRNSMGKTSIIQAIFAMFQNGKNPFRGEYMNIGKVNEVRNAISGIGDVKFTIQYDIDGKITEVSKTITQTETAVTGEVNEPINVVYCSSERIGIEDTYRKYLGDEIIIGKNCDYVFHYLNVHDEDSMDIEKDFVYDEDSKLTFGGQVSYYCGLSM